jgi:hypothetical protein
VAGRALAIEERPAGFEITRARRRGDGTRTESDQNGSRGSDERGERDGDD